MKKFVIFIFITITSVNFIGIFLTHLYQKQPVDASQEVHNETVEHTGASSNTKNKTNGSKKAAQIKKVILTIPVIKQLPELQRGCEVVSLTMMLRTAGINADKLTLAKQIKKIPFQQNGLRGNPNDGFVGNIYTFNESGLGVYHKPIAQLAKKYIGNRVLDLTGKSFDSVIAQLKQNKPVWIITNASFKKMSDTDPSWYTWQTAEGQIKVTYKEHSVLVTGFDDKNIYFNDPLTGIQNNHMDKINFIQAWEQMGKQAISYK